MATYFFDLLNDDEMTDMRGVELPNDGAARQEAKLRAINGDSFRLQKYRKCDQIRVRDASGREVCRVPIQHGRRGRG